MEVVMDNPLAPAGQSQLGRITQEIQACVLDIKNEFEDSGIPINDDSTSLQKFCLKMEFLLQLGLKAKTSLMGGKKDYWNFMCDCLAANKGQNDGIRFTKGLSEVKTSLGRGRALIRFALMHQRLADTIQQCACSSRTISDWYLAKSIWFQPQLIGEVINCLYDLNDLQFDLTPRGHDLDTSWPTFARKTFGSQLSWAPSTRSRTSSISSLQSIPTLDLSAFSLPAQEEEVDKLKDEVNEIENQKIRLETQVDLLEKDRNKHDNKMSDLEAKLEEAVKKNNEYEIVCDKLRNELVLREEVWDEKETTWRARLVEADNKLIANQNATDDSQPDALQILELSALKVDEMEKRNATLMIDLQRVKMELDSKTLLENQKTRLIDLLDMKIAQLNGRNADLMKKLEKNVIDREKGADKSEAMVAKVQTTMDGLGNLEKEREQLMRTNEELQKGNAEYKSMLHEMQEKGQKIGNIAKEKLRSYSAENKELKAENEKLKSDAEKASTASTANTDSQKDAEKVPSREERKERTDKAEFNLTIMKKNSILLEKETEILHLRSDVLDMKEEISKMREQAASRECRIEMMMRESKSAKQSVLAEVKSAEMSTSWAKDQMEDVLEENKELKEQLKELLAKLKQADQKV